MEKQVSQVLVICRRKHGLEVYEIYVRGVYACEFLSEQAAVNKATQLNRKLAA